MPEYVQFPELKGASQDAQHVDWADVSHHSFGVSHQGDVRHANHQVATEFEALSIEVPCDHLYPELIKICGRSDKMKELNLEVISGHANPVLLHKYVLTNATIRLVQRQSAGGAMSMTVALEYERIRIESRKPDGTYAITTYNCVTRRFE